MLREKKIVYLFMDALKDYTQKKKKNYTLVYKVHYCLFFLLLILINYVSSPGFFIISSQFDVICCLHLPIENHRQQFIITSLSFTQLSYTILWTSSLAYCYGLQQNKQWCGFFLFLFLFIKFIQFLSHISIINRMIFIWDKENDPEGKENVVWTGVCGWFSGT